MYAIAIDLGGTNLRVASYNEKGNLLKKVVERVDSINDQSVFINKLQKMVESVLNEKEKPMRIVVASAGILDLKKGIAKLSNNPYDIPFSDALKKYSSQLILINDCDAGVIAEKVFGAGKGEDDVIYVTISTGIGSGIISSNKLLLGKDGNATEVGHTTIDSNGKIECSCGKMGHWESFCSGGGIPKLAKLLDSNIEKYENLTSEKVFEMAKTDQSFNKVVDEVGRLNVIGISNMINTFDPSVIILGGSVALNNKDEILNPIKNNMDKHSINRIPRIEITQLGDDVILLGAAAVAIGKFSLD